MSKISQSAGSEYVTREILEEELFPIKEELTSLGVKFEYFQDRIDQMYEHMETRFNNMDHRLDAYEDRTRVLERWVSGHEDRFRRLEAKGI